MLCFFNLAGAIHDQDVAGYEVATIADARIQAALSIAEVIRDRPAVVWSGEEVRMEVTDAERNVLFTVTVVGADAPRPDQQPAACATAARPMASAV